MLPFIARSMSRSIKGASNKVTEAVKAAWVALDVPQCSYCQPGQIMSAVGVLSQILKPTVRRVHGSRQQRAATLVRDAGRYAG
jgi:aerobic-type carbon monoxide dehydrogenase small subunit (CoxS/CutS family)